MAGTSAAVDCSPSSAEIIMEQDMTAHTSLMVETRGNYATANSIVRLSAAKKFNDVDPLEAASAEIILSGGTVSTQ